MKCLSIGDYSNKGVIPVPIKKIIVCASLFLLMMVIGGILNNRITNQQMTSGLYSSSNPSIVIYSSYPSNSANNRLFPFMPREYVRIIHRTAD